MPDANVGEQVASVFERKIGKKPTDQILTSRNLFYALGKDGFKESADGGRLVEYTLMYAENTTFRSYGEWDELDTTRIQVFDAARFDWKIAAGTVSYSNLEKLRAQAGSAKFDLIAERLENGKQSHISDLNRQFWSDGTGSPTDIQGLQFLIDATPTTGTIGGINSATFTWWRNRQASGAQTASAFDNLRASWTSVYNQCGLGGDQELPTDIATTRTVFEGYEQILVAIEQIQVDQKRKNADIGFPNEFLKFKGARCWYDEDAPSGEARMFSSKHIKVTYLKGGWMHMDPAVDPYNQLANVHKLSTYCVMGVNARRHTGVVTAIT